MKALVWCLVCLGLCSVSLAGNTAGDASPTPGPPAVTSPEQVNVKPQRLAMLEFQLDPEDGAFSVQLLEPDGAKRYALDSLSVSAIGDELERPLWQVLRVIRASSR